MHPRVEQGFQPCITASLCGWLQPLRDFIKLYHRTRHQVRRTVADGSTVRIVMKYLSG
jgi:hypothetical protein